MRHVNFISTANNHAASYRMRGLIPAELLSEDGDYSCVITRSFDEKADINVFSKHWNQKEDANAIIRSKRDRLSKTVFDVCDDHFDRELGAYYGLMCAHADIVTCNTTRMQERVYECTGRLARLINDPVTFPRKAFKHSGLDEPKFVWYGNHVNLFSILPIVGQLPNLTIITDQNLDRLPEHVKTVKFEPGIVEALIGGFDIVLLPKHPYPWAKTKSPNRAIDAIQAGKFVISDFPEVYGELKDYIFLGDLKKGIDFYLENDYIIKRMVEDGQKYIDHYYSNDLIKKQWKIALTQEREDGITVKNSN